MIRHFRATQSAPLAVTGRHHELLYVLIATLVAQPHGKTVAVVDFEGRFEGLRLFATRPFTEEEEEHGRQVGGGADEGDKDGKPEGGGRDRDRYLSAGDLRHVHILRPTRGSPANIAKCVQDMEEYMLYAPHGSRERELWGMFVIGGGLNPTGSTAAVAVGSGGGGGGEQVAVTADWQGWLRVDRAGVPGFGSLSVEQALEGRERRQREVEEGGWVASSPWGGFVFGKGGA